MPVESFYQQQYSKSQENTTIDLKNSSVCTDTPTGSDLFPFSADPTQFIQNTGIERNGGISALYLQTSTFSTAGQNTVIAKTGDVIQTDSSNNVLFNNINIGNVGTLSVYARGYLPQYVDAAWSNNSTLSTIIGLKRAGGFAFTVEEYDYVNATVVNSRNITFASIGSGQPVISVSLVKYPNMSYSDNAEFLTFSGYKTVSSFLLQEASLLVSTVGGIQANFAWRFYLGATIAASRYIWGIQGITGAWAAGTITGATVATLITNGSQFTTIDITGGASATFSTAYLHFPIIQQAGGTITGIANLSYASLAASPNTTYYGSQVATTGAVTILSQASGPGYSEAAFTATTSATTTYGYYAPRPIAGDTNYFFTSISNTNTLANAYGKLSNVLGNTNKLVQWRSMMINDVPSYLSAAYPLGSLSDDNLGVPMTLIGEFDPTFVPHIVDDNSTYSKIIYRNNNGVLCYIDVRPTGSHSIQQIWDNSYLINCLSPFSVVDVVSKSLLTGPNDYNGRMQIYTGTLTTTKQVAVIIQGQMINSVDPGAKAYTNLTSTSVSLTALWPSGINIPSFVDRLPQDFGLNVYVNNNYVNTVTNYNASLGALSTFTDYELIGNLYVPDTRLPIAAGYPISTRTLQTETETVFLGVGISGRTDIDYDYAGYELGNDIAGVFQSFFLYGQRYILDGNVLWLTSFNGSLFDQKTYICPITGMTFLAASPTEAYFLSSFDNSLYIFNGGRSLTKAKRLNSEDTISNGVFNVRDNTLLLNGTNHWIWMRDSIITINPKLASQTSITAYDTQNGIQIANNTTKWIYSFYALSGSAIVPLTWQSGYHALKGNELAEVSNWVIALYSPDGRISSSVTLTSHTFDQDGYQKQAKTITINPSDWDALGFVRVRSQPQKRRVLASSIQVDITSHLVITDANIEYGDQGQARIAAKRST